VVLRAIEYGDKLAMFLLKKRRPEVYGDRMTQTHDAKRKVDP
jgi:hypothetical protein